MVTWWFSPLDRASGSPFSSFDYRYIVPLGYAAFAFTLGVALGMLTRRTLPAMAIALVAYFAVRLTVSFWLRPRLLAPAHQALALNPATTGYGYQGSILSFGSHPNSLLPASPSIPGAWITSTQIVSKTGQPLTAQVLNSTCPGIGGGGVHVNGPPPGPGSGHGEVSSGAQQTLQGCVATIGKRFHEAVSYQPASHFWPLQWYELTIYLGIAVVLGGFCVWRIRRHPG
jgi:hypothetical protein